MKNYEKKLFYGQQIKKKGFIDGELIPEIDIFEKIKTGDGNEYLINHIRHLDKSHPNYKTFKLQLPFIFPNVIYDGYGKCKGNIIDLTGYVFCDLDLDSSHQAYETKEYIKQFSFVRAAWISVSSRGIHFLVSCKGLTQNNFKSTFNIIKKETGLNLDTGAYKLTQACFISHDSDIYINDDVVPITAADEEQSYKSTYYCSSTNVSNYYFSGTPEVNYSTIIKQQQHNFMYETSPKNKNHNSYEKKINYKLELPETAYKAGEEYKFYLQGEDFIDIYIPKKGIPTGKRNRSLEIIALKLCKLNEDLDFDIIKGALHKINQNFCNPPLEWFEVESILKWVLKKRERNEINIRFKQKYTWFNPKSRLSMDEKRSIIGKNTGLVRKTRTQKLIVNAIIKLYNSNEVITQKKVAKITLKSVRTIKKYWKTYHELIKIINMHINESTKFDILAYLNAKTNLPNN